MIYTAQEFCKSCRICSEFCPTGVLGESETLNRKGYYPPHHVVKLRQRQQVVERRW